MTDQQMEQIKAIHLKNEISKPLQLKSRDFADERGKRGEIGYNDPLFPLQWHLMQAEAFGIRRMVPFLFIVLFFASL
jgi:hypothetical protein